MIDMDAVERFSQTRSLNPEHPVLRGTAQNPDIFFQAREAVKPLLRCASRRRRGVYGQSQRRALEPITSCLTTTAHPTPTERDHSHGFGVRHHRGDHRLPQRPRREARPAQGSGCTGLLSTPSSSRPCPRPLKTSLCSTAPRSPALSASRCIWISSPRLPNSGL